MKQSLTYTIKPNQQPIVATIEVPGDKSISHRSIILGSIAEGRTEVSNFLAGEDSLATLSAFTKMGVTIERVSTRVIIDGVGLYGLTSPKTALDMGNSGTAMRLLAGLLSAQKFDSILVGDRSLSKRPMQRVASPITLMGGQITTTVKGTAPLIIKGGRKLSAINYSSPVASAQIKSSLLLAALYTDGETTIMEPAISRDHTEKMLQAFGYQVNIDESRVSVAGRGILKNCTLRVPGDISSAAFFIVAACISEGSSLTIKEVGVNPTRIGIIKILQQMGAKIQLINNKQYNQEPVADIQIDYAPLHGIQIPESLIPLAIDEFPVIFIAAANAKGKTVLNGAKELRYKESDRIQAMASGLSTIGIQVEVLDDGIIIVGGDIGGGIIDSHGDHRIAMAFTIAAINASKAIQINDCGNVVTSFPSFVETCQRLGLSIEENIT